MDRQASIDNPLKRVLLDENEEPTKVPIWLLESITNNFSDDKKIGHGGFADVYKGLLGNHIVAVKKLKMIELQEARFIQEVDSLMRVKHKNIVRFLGYCSDTQGNMLSYEGKNVMAEERHRFLCFEFLPEGNLEKYISDASRGLEWRTRYQIIKGICEGLHYLHQQKIVHSDLKPANILLDRDMVPKIADFGLARCFDEEQTRAITSNVVGSLGYMAPEFFSGVITFKSDIYSLGVIITEMLTGRKEYLPVENVRESWRPRFQTSEGGTWLEHVRVCAEIGLECMDSDPAKRPLTRHIIQRLVELECAYGCIETDISPTQINPSSGSRELLHVQPDKLSCPLGLNKSIPFSLQLTNKTDDCIAFMFVDFGMVKSSTPCRSGIMTPQSTWGLVLHLELLEAGEQAVPDKQAKDMVLVRSTAVSKDFNVADITIDWFDKQSGVQDVELDIVSVAPSSQPQCDATANQGISPGSIKTELLEIYPLELRFPFEANEFLENTIHLTNRKDEDITFSIIPTNPSMYMQLDSVYFGTVSPQSTCAVTLTIKEETPLRDLGHFEILMATSKSLGHLDHYGITDTVQLRRLYMSATVKGGKAHEARLLAVISKPADPRSRILYEGTDSEKFGEMISIDVHSTEPWILTGHQKYLCLWIRREKGHSKRYIKYEVDTATDFVTKFVAGRQWVLSGDRFGKIRVFTTKLELVSTFVAHREQIRALTVHPSYSYVLSSSDDSLIKLWDLDNDWTCIREFRGHSSPVIQMAFNPKETNTFVSISNPFSSGPGNVKIWGIDSTTPKTNLDDRFEAIDYSATVSGRQYMVTVTHDGNTEVWDLQTRKCVHALADYFFSDNGVASDTNVVVCHSKLPLIFTGSTDGTVCIWNLMTFRLEHMVTFGHGAVKGFGFIEIAGYKRLVVGCANRVTLIQIDLERLVGM